MCILTRRTLLADKKEKIRRIQDPIKKHEISKFSKFWKFFRVIGVFSTLSLKKDEDWLWAVYITINITRREIFVRKVKNFWATSWADDVSDLGIIIEVFCKNLVNVVLRWISVENSEERSSQDCDYMLQRELNKSRIIVGQGRGDTKWTLAGTK